MNDGRFVCATDARNGRIIREIKSPRRAESALCAPAINRLDFHLDLLTRSLLCGYLHDLVVDRAIPSTLSHQESSFDPPDTQSLKESSWQPANRSGLQQCQEMLIPKVIVHPSLSPPSLFRSADRRSVRPHGITSRRSEALASGEQTGAFDQGIRLRERSIR